MRTRLLPALLAVLLCGCSNGTKSADPSPVRIPVVTDPGPAVKPGESAESPSSPKAGEPADRSWILEKQVAGEFGGGPKTVLLWRRETNPNVPTWKGGLRVEVREGGAEGRPLAQALVDGNKLDSLDLVEFRPGHPAIVVRFRELAVADYTAGAAVWSWVDGGLQAEGSWLGWMGSTELVKGPGGPELVVAAFVMPEQSRAYFLEELTTWPAPKLLRHERVGWQEGKIGTRKVEISRLAYRIRNESRAFEAPLSPDALKAYEAAQVLMQGQDWAGAAQRLDAALKLAPDYPVALGALAQVRFAQGDATGAAQAAKQAVDLNPWEGWAQYWLGRARLTLGDAAGAKEALWVAAAVLDDHPEVHRYLGEAFERQGGRSEAIKEYQKSLQQNPNQPEVKAALERLR